MISKYLLYSAQTYVYEPPDLWEKSIERKFSYRAPRVVTLGKTKQWVVEDNISMSSVGDIEETVIYSDYLDPSSYIQKLDQAGIAGAVLYPTIAHRSYRCLEKELLSAVLRIYNDWIIDFCNTYPNQLKAIALLNVDDPEEAVEELERTAKRGAAGVMIPLFTHTEERYDHPKYEALWSVAEKLNMPISLHADTVRQTQNNEAPFDLTLNDVNSNDTLYRFIYSTCQYLYPRIAIASIILSGVFARHSSLRLVTVGFGTDWIPYFLTRTDEMYEVRPERG